MNQTTDHNEIKKVIKQFKTSLLFVGLFSVFINFLGLTQIFYMLQVFDRVLQSRSESTLLMLTLVIIILYVSLGLLTLIRAKLLNRLSNRFDVELNERVFDAVLEHAAKHKSEGAAQPLFDLAKLRQFFNSPSLFVFFDAPWLPFYLGVMYLFHPWLAYYGLVTAVLIISLALINNYMSKSRNREASHSVMQSSNFINANMRNIEVITALGMHERIKERWLALNAKFLTSQSQSSDANAKYSSLSKTFRQFAQTAIIGLSAYLVIQGEMTAGMMIGGMLILGKALAPLDLFIVSWNNLSEVKLAYQRLLGLFKFYHPKEERLELNPPTGQIRLSRLFWTPDNIVKPIINDISFELEAGESLAILGESGAGKSTLAKLMIGVHKPSNGEIRLDNAELSHWNKESLGKYIGYLPQNIELFNATVSENISRFGEHDAGKIIAAAQFAGIHEMILNLPNAYETRIGETGFPLSGGQRQMIGLARAVYNEPVYVVLDEPNAGLDDKFENALIHCLEKLKERKTTIVMVTHKRELLSRMDKLLLLTGGVLQIFGPRARVLEIMAVKAKAAINNASRPLDNIEI